MASNCCALQKNVASQKWVVFAFDDTDNSAKTGDAGNITANLRIDGAAADGVDDTNPTELEDGYYIFDLTQGETNGDYILICPASTTANIQVIGCPMAAWTMPPYFSSFSIDSNGRIDVIKIAGTSQTANDMSGDIDDILTDTSTTLDDFIDTEIAAIVAAVITNAAGTDIAADIIAIKAETASILTDTGTTIPGTITTAQNDLDTITGGSGVLIDTDAVDADALKTDAVNEIWAKAMSDLAAGAPSATASVLTAINYLYEAWRNQTWATSSEIAIYKDDASTKLVESTISDDGTTFKRGEMRNPD